MKYDHIEEIQKFNPFHDSQGRFASESSYTSFTYKPGKSKAHDLAIQRMKDKANAAGGTTIDGVDIADKLPEPVKVDITLPELEGSPSQKEWAENIRADAHYYVLKKLAHAPSDNPETIKEYLDAMQSKKAMTDLIKGELWNDEVNQEIISDMCADFKEAASWLPGAKELFSVTDAKFWIDHNGHYAAQKDIYDSILAGRTKIVKDSLPANLSQVKRLVGNTYPFKDQIKAAGFQWSSGSKSWYNPNVSKSAADMSDNGLGIDKIEEIN